ncbi:transporter [Lithospermum erythrorhizon]|uniref:Transporter n=1 Tax=Lithospermum erythrorhizon TaxID=34254 RepID=A0AAV3PN52_LITER
MKPNNEKQLISSSWLLGRFNCFYSTPKQSPEMEYDDTKKQIVSEKKPGGWRAMPYVIGNETFERLATVGLLSNFLVFLMTQFHMDQVSASNVIFIWSGVGNFAPLIGAYISDAYVGRFLTIAFSSVASLMGMLTLTLIAWIPQLHPPTCTQQEAILQQCIGPNKSQIGVLILALGFLVIGTGGIRPCNIPFGVDQFDSSTKEGRKGINSFFNWYYTSFTVVIIIALTLIVYIQTSVSWAIGFAIPTVLMVCGIALFFFGTRVYIYVKPEGSVFSGIGQAIVAAYKKRKLKLDFDGLDVHADGRMLYDPPLMTTNHNTTKLSLTKQFRCLNKAAIITEGDITPQGDVSKPWRLASIQQIEQVKCILRIFPIWASGIICFVAIAQQATFTISQALKMDRHMGPKFEVPPGSLGVISMITIGIWLPIYDRIIVPSLRKITKIEGGITLLQRIGIGLVFSVLSMVVAGLIEIKRRASAINGTQISVFWVAPQLILMGFAEAFNIIGQIEFYNKEFPENMSSVANSLFACTMAGANYLSSALVNIVHQVTRTNDHPDWLTKDLNQGRLENYYFVIAIMGVLNIVYFLFVSPRYHYKSRVMVEDGGNDLDIEMNGTDK